jgi:hypothetical protein
MVGRPVVVSFAAFTTSVRLLLKNESAPTTTPPAFSLRKNLNTFLSLCEVLTSTRISSRFVAFFKFWYCTSSRLRSRLRSTPIFEGAVMEANATSNLSRIGSSSEVCPAVPVKFPPGLARLSTSFKPCGPGSWTVVKTTGFLFLGLSSCRSVTCCATTAARVPPAAMITRQSGSPTKASALSSSVSTLLSAYVSVSVTPPNLFLSAVT